MTKYRVWYMHPDFFPTFILGDELPTFAGIKYDRTHVLLRAIEAEDLDDVYYQQQAFNWAKDARATNRLLAEKGLKHSSMSVGDVIEDVMTGQFWAVRNAGFEEIEQCT